MSAKVLQKIKQLLVIGILSVFTFGIIPRAFSSDHADGPKALRYPAADITDMYAWMQDTATLNLIMNVFPNAPANAQFSSSVQYTFHVSSSAAYGSPKSEKIINCTFDSDQNVTCKLGVDVLIQSTKASAVAGVSSTDGTFKIFTGRRSDPFYFDQTNFELARKDVRDQFGSFVLDTAGCPSIDDTTRGEFFDTYTAKIGALPGANVPGKDSYQSQNILSIVIQIKTFKIGPGPVYSVWGSTTG